MMGGIFALYVRHHKAAAAAGDDQLPADALADGLGALARWWDKFATVEVDSVEGISGQATLESAESVAAAIRAWHERGRRRRPGLLATARRAVPRRPKRTPWSSTPCWTTAIWWPPWRCWCNGSARREEIALVEEDYSFHDLALVWMEDALAERRRKPPGRRLPGRRCLPAPRRGADAPRAVGHRWSRKFLDYLEANAEEYWQVPQFEMAADPGDDSSARQDRAQPEGNGRGSGVRTRNSTRTHDAGGRRPVRCGLRRT